MVWLGRGILLLALAGIVWTYRDTLADFAATRIPGLSPHDRHAFSLRLRGLASTPDGRAWLHDAEATLENPPLVRAPFAATGDVGTREAGARAWRFHARRGQRLIAHAQFAAGESFLDLIDLTTGLTVASGRGAASPLTHDVGQDGDFALRLQPSFRAAGPFTLTQVVRASLGFPVQDVSSRAVQSVFGDNRDAGRRSHEGIDIFAPRGTPVVAASDGWILGSTTNRLGGNVVWQWSPAHGVTLYYAHLDRHAVSPGARVRAGEILGYVGNTGNARGTAPHLHFGVYARGEGAVDPYPFVVDPSAGERSMHKAPGTRKGTP